MLKGVNRNVIVMRTDRSSRFEAIYFVVKRGHVRNKADVLKEASRIVEDSETLEKYGRVSGRGAIVFIGVLLGFAISSILWLTVILVVF